MGGACEKKGGEGEAESNSNPGGCKARFVQAKKNPLGIDLHPPAYNFLRGRRRNGI